MFMLVNCLSYLCNIFLTFLVVQPLIVSSHDGFENIFYRNLFLLDTQDAQNVDFPSWLNPGLWWCHWSEPSHHGDSDDLYSTKFTPKQEIEYSVRAMVSLHYTHLPDKTELQL